MAERSKSLDDVVKTFSDRHWAGRRQERDAQRTAKSRASLDELINGAVTIIAPRIEGNGFLVWVANGPAAYREQKHVPTIDAARSLADEMAKATGSKIDDWTNAAGGT